MKSSLDEHAKNTEKLMSDIKAQIGKLEKDAAVLHGKIKQLKQEKASINREIEGLSETLYSITPRSKQPPQTIG